MPVERRNSERVFIDTFFVLALINSRDAQHARARSLLPVYRDAPAITTDAVLLEIGNGLARDFRAEAHSAILGLLSSSRVEVVRLTPSWLDRSLSFYETHADKQWGLVDCFSFVLMRERGLQRAPTFDQHFVQAGFQALMR